MRCNNPCTPPQPKYQRKPFSHIYHHDKLLCKCLCWGQEEKWIRSSTSWWLSWYNLQLARRASLTGKSSAIFFCLLHVWNRSRQVPSISFPPCAALYEPHLADYYSTTTTTSYAVDTCAHTLKLTHTHSSITGEAVHGDMLFRLWALAPCFHASMQHIHMNEKSDSCPELWCVCCY